MTATPAQVAALRVQAAAVAAQQAALVEDEWRLDRRAEAVAQQEAQLARHLETRQTRLEGLRVQVSDGREALRRERAEARTEAQDALAEADRQRREAEAAHREALGERDRVRLLRRRFVARWQRHWEARRVEVDARAEAVAAREREVIAAQAKLDAGRATFETEATLFRARLEESQGHYERRERQLLEAVRRREAEVSRRESELDRRAAGLADEMQVFAVHRGESERKLSEHAGELAAVERRILAARESLAELERRRRDGTSPTPATLDIALVPAKSPPAHDAELTRLAETLADHRRVLVEQFGRLVAHEQAWRDRAADAVDDMEQIADEMEEAEGRIFRRDRTLASVVAQVEARSRRAETERRLLEALRHRVTAEADRARLALGRERLAVEEREAEVTAREATLEAFVHRLSERRRLELHRLRETLDQADRERQVWIDDRDRWEVAQAGMVLERQELAERAAALERTRLEWVADASEPARRQLVRVTRALARERARLTTMVSQREDDLFAERAAFETDITARTAALHRAAASQVAAADRLAAVDHAAYVEYREALRAAERHHAWRRHCESLEAAVSRLADEAERLVGREADALLALAESDVVEIAPRRAA